MKYVLILFFFTEYAFGQIPKNANTIIIRGISFNEVLEHILDKGYAIEKKDNDLKTVTTEKKVYPKKYNASYKISVRVKGDSLAYLTATFRSPDSDPLGLMGDADPVFDNSPLYNDSDKSGKTRPSSLIGYGFLLVNDFALSFNKPLEYIKQ